MYSDEMSESGEDAYRNHNYRLAAEIFRRAIEERGANCELYLGYAKSLAKCGQLRESLDVYSHCSRIAGAITADTLRPLTESLLGVLVSTAGSHRRVTDAGFACPACEGVLHMPVTVECGHTFCRKCAAGVAACEQCGQRMGKCSAGRETNVAVRQLTEKWWRPQVEAARLREEGDELYERNCVEAALMKYEQAIEFASHDHRVLCSRSRALHRLNRHQAALADADTVVKLKPGWAKGHYRRGVALSSAGRYKEALPSLCISAALDGDGSDVSADVSHALCRLLTAPPRVRCHSPGATAAPYARGPARHRQRYLLMAHRQPALYSDNESEDYDSSEDDVSLRTSKLHSLLDSIFLEVKVALESCLQCAVDLPIDPQLVDKSDFDCILCCRLLCSPVTTPCGHTYCRACLDRCLDYSSACPLCMASLETYLSSSQRSATLFLDLALTTLLPGAYASRRLTARQELRVASANHHVPMFVCTTSFPGVSCPLFVYEPRYRNMVRRCVLSTRQFGIVACLTREPGARRYADYGTLQEIMDCVLLPDGCSIVSTVGRRRFKVIARGERDGYDTAQVEFIEDQPIEPGALQEIKTLHDHVRWKSLKWLRSTNPTMQAEIVRTFGEMPPVEEDWASNIDGPAWAWWLLAILPLDPRLQVGILATTVLEKRLRAIDKMLAHIQQNQVTPISEPSPESVAEMEVASSLGAVARVVVP